MDKQLVQEMIRMAQPVLKWLQEAEEESEEEDGVAVAFDDRSRAIGTTVVEETKKAGSGKENNKEEGKKAKENGQKVVEAKEAAEDIDIDNIWWWQENPRHETPTFYHITIIVPFFQLQNICVFCDGS